MSRDIEQMCKRDSYEDIARRANMDVAVIRHVLKHEYESYVDRLCSGEKVVIPGFCTSEPVIKERIGTDGKIENYVTIKQHPSGVLIDKINNVENFKIKRVKKDNVEVGTLNELA